MRETVKEGNSFVVKDNGEMVAEITYKPAAKDMIVIDHTYVSPAMRGQKLAEDLVRRVVEHAREANKMVVPSCSYAHAQFKRHNEYQDVWKRDQ
ncbi:GNAT family acetyltraansferase [Cohnella kolymensis]|uniref:GNAT family acetyltraansferase n=1 Tax=Cohnella kolymensis TaxID=1590652 RepID=A0ABR5A9P2_9BACL|nr:GNAT family N-acetyltransferase [Cohnella kolymensis]KIL37612.1 GNAT family acetyltraansferase [Cohnella kolymensis]